MSKIAEGLRPLTIPIDGIEPDPRNARLHPEPNLNAIKKSLEAYGQRKPIVVNRRTKHIEAGNGLYAAAKALGWEDVAVVFVDDDKETAIAYGVMDNKSAVLADWDLPSLTDLLVELDSKAYDLSSTGFSDEEISELLNQGMPEHSLSSRLSKGYVEGIEEIDPLKLAYRLESICHCRKRDLAVDLFSGTGRLAFWYKRLFRNVVRVDKETYDGIDYNETVAKFLPKHLGEFAEFDFIDFDDEGCPGKELQTFFSLIEGRKDPFVLCVTDGMGLALKVRGKINLYDKYLLGINEPIKIKDNSEYEHFDQYLKHLIDTLCARHGFRNRILNWHRGANGNVIYAGFEITALRT